MKSKQYMKKTFKLKLKTLLLLLASFTSVTMTSAHRIEYFTGTGCITIGQPLSMDAYVVAAAVPPTTIGSLKAPMVPGPVS